MSCPRVRRWVVLLGAIVIASSGACAAAEAVRPLTAASLERDIKANGAVVVVKQLKSRKGENWQKLVHKVESGNVEWLHVAGGLLKATDAGDTESLHFALSIALTRNAEGVLSLLGPEVPADRICTVPYIEPSAKEEEEYRTKARASIAKVLKPELALQKNACLKELAVGEKKPTP